MTPILTPSPQRLTAAKGTFRTTTPLSLMTTGDAGLAELVTQIIGVSTVADADGSLHLCLVDSLDLNADLRPEQWSEAHRITITPDRITVEGQHREGLLRAIATLAQLAEHDSDAITLPCLTIEDWPMVRFRCAADWLVNVECNRWALDRGDGHDAFLARVQRKLDFCFRHKINTIWFDGFGWDTERFPGYAPLVRQCTDAARRLGIRLTFAGYGGGYGTAYQPGEIYRCGYFGHVYRNRQPYPDGEEYPCRGMPDPKSRFFGTCLSNDALRTAKLIELTHFVNTVRPGCIYVHDIDAATWNETEPSWKLRCDDCRKRWPSDALDDPDGQAGACGDWHRQIRETLNALPEVDGYRPSRDLQLITASPLYTHYRERDDAIWQREVNYYATLSRAIGPLPGISFTLREQFTDAEGRPRFAELRRGLDEAGCGHGFLVAAFGGGDTFRSDDLTNTIGATAHFYEGADAVYLSNAGIHSDPVQMLNAECLWAGAARGFKDKPPAGTSTEAWFDQICMGTHKPETIFGEGAIFDQFCSQRWGDAAGPLMSRALQARCEDRLPIGYVWWSITEPVQAMAAHAPTAFFRYHERDWSCRIQATEEALSCAERAAAVSDDEDVHWLACCLEIGRQFATILRQLIRVEAGRLPLVDATLPEALNELEALIRSRIGEERADILGGDPGCWLPTLQTLRELAERFSQRRESTLDVATDFLDAWWIGGTHRTWPGALCGLRDMFEKTDRVTLSCHLHCEEAMPLAIHLGSMGPVQLLIDDQLIWDDPDGKKGQAQMLPAPHQAAIIPWNAEAGRHSLTLRCRPNARGEGGIFARLLRQDGGHSPLPEVCDHEPA